MPDSYDVIVIGAGPAGENVAPRAAAAGLSVLVVEAELAGGECSYWACMPSKALLRPGEVLAAARRVPGADAAVTGEIDLERVFERRDKLAGNFDDEGQVDWIRGTGAAFVRGHGRLAGERRVEVTDSEGAVATYEARKAVVIATGTGAAVPPVPGLRDITIWDNREATTAKDVPRRLLVLGGGVVGVEMAQAWKTLGADEVTIVEMEDRLLPREEPFAGADLAAAFARLGIVVRTGVAMAEVRRDGVDGPVTGTLEDGTTIVADEILVAAGRRPHTADVGLETVGLQPGGYLEVDDQMRVRGVGGGWLYAVGDVNGRALLTHAGKYQARVAGDHIAGKDAAAWGDVRATPRVVFTDPQVAAVGLTKAQAREQGVDVRAIRWQTGAIAGAATLGRGIKGTSQWLVDEERKVLVGATFVGPGIGELLHAATIAIAGEVPLDTLWHAIPAFPTLSEIWLRLLEAYGL